MNSRAFSLLAAALFAAIAASAQQTSVSTAAATAPAVAVSTPAAKAWSDSTELTLFNTTGNSRATTLGGTQLFADHWGRTALEVKGNALKTRSQGQTTAEQYEAGQKLRWTLSPWFYDYERFLWDKNRFAGVDDRYDASAGLGAKLLDDNPRESLDTELGAGYVDEERLDSPNNRFAAGRAYAKYCRAVGPSARVSQDVEYIYDLGHVHDYRLNTETALTDALSAHLSMKISYKWKRVNRPPAGFLKNDTITAASLIVNY